MEMDYTKDLRYAEFCTGIGGFRLGIEMSDLKANLVYANEIDDKCEMTYESNFGKKFDSKDIFNVIPDNIPNFDLLCAGFPCQPFSQAGKGKGFADDRGTVFFQLLRIIRGKQPKILFFENVPNLKRHDHGNTFKVIHQNLEKEGYVVYDSILDSAYFGVPQSRPRLYLVCFKKQYFPDIQFAFTEKRTSKIGLRKFLVKSDNSIPISKRWQQYIDLYTNRINLNELTFSVPKTRKKLERIAKNCDLRDCVFQIRSSGIRAYSLDEPFPTFAVSNSGGGAMIPVLSKERRHLSLTEMRRIMGFPEWFNLGKVSRTDAIKELANAVVPPVIASICNDISSHIAHFKI